VERYTEKPHGLELVAALGDEVHDLVEPRRKEIERRHDRAVGTESVLGHDLLVVDRVADINVGAVARLAHGRIEIDDVVAQPALKGVRRNTL
jgi:hypothetical protein